MFPQTRNRIGAPRFDPVQRLYHRLYEPLVLLSIINRTRSADEPDLSSTVLRGRARLDWRRFVDGLSELCDYDGGGKTVCAVAAEMKPVGPVFWMAAPHDKQSRHLECVLKELTELRDVPGEDLPAKTNIMVTKCVLFGRRKVKNYAKLLCNSIEKTSEQPDNMIRASEELISELGMFYARKDMQLELCSMAATFCQCGGLAELSKLTDGRDERSNWLTIRHYVGRLSRWHRTIQTLIGIVSKYPQWIDNYTVEFVQLPSALPAPIPDQKTNLESALKRMLPKGREAHVQELFLALSSMRGFDIAESFEDRYKDDNFRPQVHAEVMLMDHFYSKRLDFVLEERYIGCSKPSCYCCSLYTRFHPGHFVLRANHGNLWINWAPPSVSFCNEEDGYKHTKAILNSMIQYIRSDLISEIEAKSSQRARIPDSSTGL